MQPDKGAWASRELGFFLRKDIKVFSRQAIESFQQIGRVVEVLYSHRCIDQLFMVVMPIQTPLLTAAPVSSLSIPPQHLAPKPIGETKPSLTVSKSPPSRLIDEPHSSSQAVSPLQREIAPSNNNPDPTPFTFQSYLLPSLAPNVTSTSDIASKMDNDQQLPWNAIVSHIDHDNVDIESKSLNHSYQPKVRGRHRTLPPASSSGVSSSVPTESLLHNHGSRRASSHVA